MTLSLASARDWSSQQPSKFLEEKNERNHKSYHKTWCLKVAIQSCSNLVVPAKPNKHQTRHGAAAAESRFKCPSTHGGCRGMTFSSFEAPSVRNVNLYDNTGSLRDNFVRVGERVVELFRGKPTGVSARFQGCLLSKQIIHSSLCHACKGAALVCGIKNDVGYILSQTRRLDTV